MYFNDGMYLDESTCKTRLKSQYLSGAKRYRLDVIMLRDCGIEPLIKAYSDITCDSIEAIIEEIGNFIGELLVDYPQYVFMNEGSISKLRSREIGFTDVATGGYVKYNMGTLIDAYIVQKIANQAAKMEGFALGVAVDGKR